MKTYDALVIGAGPAGATAALRLARAGLAVAVVEKAAFPRRKVCGEFISATTWPLLSELGIGAQLLRDAGPPVRRVALYAGKVGVDAPMPAPEESEAWGRALGREVLDAVLLDRAARSGADVWQPFGALGWEEVDGHYRVAIEDDRCTPRELRARVLVAAHGSWERGMMPTQPGREPPQACDLLGFKARFLGAALPPGLMPLILFPGGYGGLVHSGGGCVSFSCCIRRDALRLCRAAHPGMPAGECVLAHVMESSGGVRDSLGGARRESAWLSAGPIRPGIRPRSRGRVFTVGNAAGEAHPLVAEGISMAIQSAWLLGEEIAGAGTLGEDALREAGARYAAAWDLNFAARVRASSLFAAVTGSPLAAGASIALMRRMPPLLTWGARWSGKGDALRRTGIAA